MGLSLEGMYFVKLDKNKKRRFVFIGKRELSILENTIKNKKRNSKNV